MLNWLIDLFFPRQSLRGTEGALLTSEELADIKLQPLTISTEQIRSAGLQALDVVHSALEYKQNSLIQTALHRFKYVGVSAWADELADLIVAAHGDRLQQVRGVLCPVPLHWLRHSQRGFNQAELLAHVLSKQTGLPVRSLLKRTKQTGYQSHRNRVERMQSLRGVFRFVVHNVPEEVILIDDLITTGATLDSCAKMLKENGVKHVSAITVAASRWHKKSSN